MDLFIFVNTSFVFTLLHARRLYLRCNTSVGCTSWVFEHFMNNFIQHLYWHQRSASSKSSKETASIVDHFSATTFKWILLRSRMTSSSQSVLKIMPVVILNSIVSFPGQQPIMHSSMWIKWMPPLFYIYFSIQPTVFTSQLVCCGVKVACRSNLIITSAQHQTWNIEVS